MDALDSSRAAVPAEILAVWRDEGAAQRLRNRFVTGGRAHRRGSRLGSRLRHRLCGGDSAAGSG